MTVVIVFFVKSQNKHVKNEPIDDCIKFDRLLVLLTIINIQMKRLKSALFLFSILACSKTETIVQPVETKCKILESSMSNNSTNTESISKYEYDSNNNLVSVANWKSLIPNGNPTKKEIFSNEYDDKNQLIKATNLSTNEYIKYTYHTNGKVKTKLDKSLTSENSYEYNQESKLLKNSILSNGIMKTTEYIFEGINLVLQKSLQNNVLISTITNQYNKKNLLLKSTKTDQNSTILEESNYTYDDKGLLKESSTKNNSTNLLIDFSNVRDDKGNIVLQSKYTNGKLSEQRKYEYISENEYIHYISTDATNFFVTEKREFFPNTKKAKTIITYISNGQLASKAVTNAKKERVSTINEFGNATKYEFYSNGNLIQINEMKYECK